MKIRPRSPGRRSGRARRRRDAVRRARGHRPGVAPGCVGALPCRRRPRSDATDGTLAEQLVARGRRHRGGARPHAGRAATASAESTSGHIDPAPEAIALLPQRPWPDVCVRCRSTIERRRGRRRRSLDPHPSTLASLGSDPAPGRRDRRRPAADLKRAIGTAYRATDERRQPGPGVRGPRQPAPRGRPARDRTGQRRGAGRPGRADDHHPGAARPRLRHPHRTAGDRVRVRYRIDGALHDVLDLPGSIGPALVSRIKIMAGMNIVERRRPQDGQISMEVEERERRHPGLDHRRRRRREGRACGCSTRAARSTALSQLGMPADTAERYSALIHSPYGMVICAGPTGSGKTTTLYASLGELNTPERNIMTIEDPVEYTFDTINQIQINEQAGITFAGRPAVDPPPGPRRDPGRRDPRRRHRADRGPVGADRPPRALLAARDRRGRGALPAARHGHRVRSSSPRR